MSDGFNRGVNLNRCVISGEMMRIKRLEAELRVATARCDKLLAERNAESHVLIRCGVVPGIDSACRCDECWSVARSMSEAGYLDDVEDKWWEKEAIDGNPK